MLDALRCLVAITCLVKSMAGTADPLDALAAKSSLAGAFTQSIVSSEGVVLEQAEGLFQLLRPHYFWWQIQEPDQQLLIAVDDKLTQIDWDLEVIAQRNFTPQDRTVLQWLLSPKEDIESAFVVEKHGQTLVLAARDGNAPVTNLTIEHSPITYLWRLTMTDSGGQVINLALKEDPDRLLRPEDFVFPDTDFD